MRRILPSDPARGSAYLEADWRREALRTNLWVVPAVEALLAIGLFAITHQLDQASYNGQVALPAWVLSGGADPARQILTTIAAAIITVVGVVFSITIVALTLASTQFGPRMLRNFIRDRGTQLTLGTFVATFLYTILVLVSIRPGPHGDVVPHLSITVTLALTVADLAVLIYFINHIASTIQLPQVIAAIARDLSQAIDAEDSQGDDTPGEQHNGPSCEDLLARIDQDGAAIPTTHSGYLQVIRHQTLARIAAEADAVIYLPYRPGHFLVRGHALAYVWPAAAADQVSEHLERGHVTGPYRTLTQDVSFGIDQLVEIALRALSPAVNDTFTALTCVDWLGDSLSKICARGNPVTVHRDRDGRVRVITVAVSDERLIERAFEKIRQAGRGMPAVMIRQLDAIASIMNHAATDRQRGALRAQATMILNSATAVPEERDRRDIQRAYDVIDAQRSPMADPLCGSRRPAGARP